MALNSKFEMFLDSAISLMRVMQDYYGRSPPVLLAAQIGQEQLPTVPNENGTVSNINQSIWKGVEGFFLKVTKKI